MTHNLSWIILLIGVLGCAAPHAASTPVSGSPDSGSKELSELKELLKRLEKRVIHLETELSAGSAEDEFTTLTIDSAEWSDGTGLEPRDKAANHVLLCHVVEWKDFGKMLRFTRRADHDFVLEAEGHPPVRAITGTGGMTSDDGRIRSVMLYVLKPLEPNANYHLVPSNRNEKYRWSVSADLVVLAPEPQH